jgi:hypothetical protein
MNTKQDRYIDFKEDQSRKHGNNPNPIEKKKKKIEIESEEMKGNVQRCECRRQARR